MARHKRLIATYSTGETDGVPYIGIALPLLFTTDYLIREVRQALPRGVLVNRSPADGHCLHISADNSGLNSSELLTAVADYCRQQGWFMRRLD